MANTLATSPGTMVDDATVGTVAWATPDNAKVSDNAYAVALTIAQNVTTHYLKATNFGFSIPLGATINGILVEFERQSVYGSRLKDNSVKIVMSGTISGDDKATATLWTGTDSYESHGGSSDLWGLTWTSTDINAADFGVAISAINTFAGDDNAYIDHIRITVYYTEAAGGARLTATGRPTAGTRQTATGRLVATGRLTI